MISELRSISHRDRGTVSTGGDRVAFRISSVIAFVSSVSSVRISSTTGTRVVLGFDKGEVNRQESSEQNNHESGSYEKPERRSLVQGRATFGLN